MTLSQHCHLSHHLDPAADDVVAPVSRIRLHPRSLQLMPRKIWSLLQSNSSGSDYSRQGTLTEWERMSTVDLLVVTSVYPLPFIFCEDLFTFLQNKQPWWGGQPYWAFPFSYCSLLQVSMFLCGNHSSLCWPSDSNKELTPLGFMINHYKVSIC